MMSDSTALSGFVETSLANDSFAIVLEFEGPGNTYFSPVA
jgi:hypothetical protein